MSDQQEEILYFVKESIELENKQIQEVVVGQFYIVFISFSGSIYIFEKGGEAEENCEDDDIENSTSESVESNQPLKGKEDKQVEKKKNLFLDFDHKLELPFAKTLILNDTPNEIKLLIVAKNGDMCFLTIHIQLFKIINYQQKMLTLDISQREEKLIKNAKIIENTKLLIIYPYQIYLIQNVQFQKPSIQAQQIFEVDVEMDQIDYYNNILSISTKKRYYILNLQSQQSIKLGSVKSIDMQEFYGITFFPRNQNEFVMAARPNGFMWKAQTDTGKVLTTLQFTDEDNNKLNFGRLFAFNRYILSINGHNRLYIIDMNDKQLITKVYHNCSQLTFVYNQFNSTDSQSQQFQNERSFYLYYMENGKNLVIERCSIKNIQRSFEASLSKNYVGQCAELFEKYETLQNIKNLKSLLKANLQNPIELRHQFSSSFKDSIKKIEDNEFMWMREKEIDQKCFKNGVYIYDKNNQNKNSNNSSEKEEADQNGNIYKKHEDNITKILDINNMKWNSNQGIKLTIKEVLPQAATILYSLGLENIGRDEQISRRLLKNNKNKQFPNLPISQKSINQKIQENNIKVNKNNSLQWRNSYYTNNLQKNINLAKTAAIEMIQKSTQQSDNSKNYKQSRSSYERRGQQIINTQLQNMNVFIHRKIDQYKLMAFQENILQLLKERNPYQRDFIDQTLSRYDLCFLLQHLSRNFLKMIINVPSLQFCSSANSSQFTYTFQLKSSIDILSDTTISCKSNKQQIIRILQYYLGEDLFSEIQQEQNIRFDEISLFINQFQLD